MRLRFFILTACLLLRSAHGAVESWDKWLVPELRQIETKRGQALAELDRLGVPVVGQTAPEIGFQHEHVRIAPLTADYVQVDLGEPQPVDSVVLVPAVMNWQSVDQPAYGFPLRFQIAISDEPRFEKFILLKSYTDEDFPNPGVAPAAIPGGGKIARYVRISVTKMPQENGLYFFALGEVMVISGNRNIAINCPVRARGNVEIPLHFSRQYLTDGRTHLGPPIRRDFLKWDGLHAGEVSNTIAPWMELDLGRICPVQEVRLYPTHARLGADSPGFRFPKSFKVEACARPDFLSPIVLMDARDFSNPGDNPVTIPATGAEARYIKVTARNPTGPGGPRFSLSEIQVYSGGTNVALGAAVTRTPDNFPSSKAWPISILVDGYTSLGKLMELPEWLRDWERRRLLQLELKELDARESVLLATARQRGMWAGSSMVFLGLFAIASFWIVSNLRIKRQLHSLRAGLARDIHDHIGSNLAGIAVLSDVARENKTLNPTQLEDWDEVNHVARETIEVMREVIWLISDKKGTELDLVTQMQLAASRMLAGRKVSWKSAVAQLPPALSRETRRDIFLFFKEALTNIVRHSGARHVELSAQLSVHSFQLGIADDGCGFDPRSVRAGIGLNSQRMRARALGGSVKIVTASGAGTRVCLTVPIRKWRRHLRFINKWRHS